MRKPIVSVFGSHDLNEVPEVEVLCIGTDEAPHEHRCNFFLNISLFNAVEDFFTDAKGFGSLLN